MRQRKTITTSLKKDLIARINLQAARYNMAKNKVIELALSRLFESTSKAELSLTLKQVKKNKGILAFSKNAADDAITPLSGKKLKQKEIYYADLNSKGGGGKTAPVPVVIVSGNTLNSRLGMPIVCPITDKLKYFGGSIKLKKDKVNNLKCDSQILAFQVKSISHERLTKKIGEITDRQLAQTIYWIRKILKW